MTLPFSIKKAHKPPNCIAMRCTNLAADKLCDKHEQEWVAAGRPALEYAAPAPKARTSGGSSAIVLAPEQAAEVTEARHKLQNALAFAQEFPLDTPEQREQAQTIANGFHAQAKTWEAKLKSILAPFKEGIARLKDEVQPNIDTALAIKKTLLDRLGAKNLELELERDRALAAIAANAGAAEPAAYVAAHVDLAAPAESGGFVDVYSYEVVDAAAVPLEFQMAVINHPKLAAHVKEHGDRNVPAGVKVSMRRVARAA